MAELKEVRSLDGVAIGNRATSQQVEQHIHRMVVGAGLITRELETIGCSNDFPKS